MNQQVQLLYFIIIIMTVTYIGASGNKTSEVDTHANSTSEISFLDWHKWRKLFKSCSPKRNPHLSPIEIYSSSAEKEEDMPALIIHSKAPVEDSYLLSTFYDVDNIQMESFNIKLIGDELLREATYISGLGYDDPLYYKSSLIMFGPGNNDKPLHEHQSFHRIDAKEFPMEIMLTFHEAHMGQAIVQIHILVELTEVENPAWKPLLDGFSDLIWKIIHEKCFGDEHVRNARERLKKAEALHKEAFLKEKNETRGLTYKRAVNELTILKNSLKDVKEGSLETLSEQQLDALVKQQKCRQEQVAINDSIKKLDHEIFSLRKAKSLDAKRDAKVAKLEAEQSELQTSNSKLQNCIEEEGKRANKLKRERSRQIQLLKSSRVGNGSTDLFRSVQDVSNLLDKMQVKLADLTKIENEVEEAKKASKNLIGTPPRSILIKEPFQISWLFPSNGGFFVYNGSSPIPPCKQRSQVVVLEKPITISQEQLNEFRNFPSITRTDSNKIMKICNSMKMNENGNETTNVKTSGRNSDDLKNIVKEMEKMVPHVPHIMTLGNRSLWYNPKNIQFKDDDGMHMKSSARRKLKELYQESSAVKLKDWFNSFFKLLF